MDPSCQPRSRRRDPAAPTTSDIVRPPEWLAVDACVLTPRSAAHVMTSDHTASLPTPALRHARLLPRRMGGAVERRSHPGHAQAASRMQVLRRRPPRGRAPLRTLRGLRRRPSLRCRRALAATSWHGHRGPHQPTARGARRRHGVCKTPQPTKTTTRCRGPPGRRRRGGGGEKGDGALPAMGARPDRLKDRTPSRDAA
jgi:hypothetical protein